MWLQMQYKGQEDAAGWECYRYAAVYEDWGGAQQLRA